MSVTAINCTPIKPHVSFGKESEKINDDHEKSESEIKKEKFDMALQKANDFGDQFVKADDVKTPFQTVLSVAVAAGKTFIHGASTFLGLDVISKGDLSVKINQGGKNLVDKMDNIADDIAKSATTNEISSKSKKLPSIKKYASSALKHVSSAAKKIGKKYPLPILAGVVAAIAIVPAICSRDNNKDGVKDIAQKSQSAYDKFETKSSKMLEGASKFAEIVSLIS